MTSQKIEYKKRLVELANAIRTKALKENDFHYRLKMEKNFTLF